MDVELVTFDLDLVLGLRHRFRLCVLELFHDNDIVVVDAIRYIDETVVGVRVIFIFRNRMVLILYRIIRIPLLVTKGYDAAFCIGCTRRINDRSRSFITNSHAISHGDSSLVTSSQSTISPCTGAAAGNTHGIIALHRRRDAANGDGILTDAEKGIAVLICRILVVIGIFQRIPLSIYGYLARHIASAADND